MKPQHFALLAGSLALVALLLLAAGRQANPAGSVATQPPRTVTVLGEGAVPAKPDQVALRFGAWTRGASAVEAEALNGALRQRVTEALRGAGAEAAAIATTAAVVVPEQARDYAGVTHIAGYEATSEVLVTLRNLNKVGEVVDAALAAGATSKEPPSYSLQNPDPVRQEALKAALANARSRALALAGAGGRDLGSLLSVKVLEESPASASSEGLSFRARIEATFAY